MYHTHRNTTQYAQRGPSKNELLSKIRRYRYRYVKYSFCDKLYRLVDLADDADWVLFSRMQNKQHCLHTMLPPVQSHRLERVVPTHVPAGVRSRGFVAAMFCPSGSGAVVHSHSLTQ